MSDTKPERDVTIAVTRYAEPDSMILRSLRKALDQQGVRGEVLYIEQQVASVISEADFPDGNLVLRIIRQPMAGLSAARNLAIDEARSSLVLFLDADALAAPDWACELSNALSHEGCALVGGRVIPGWPAEAPYFSKARVLRDQYSLLDLGHGTQRYHRVVGAGFGVDMSKLQSMRFDTSLGRRRGLLFGGEESDFCRRARAHGFDACYVGSACVTHLIAPERCRWRWILKRMVYAGHGRARMGGAPRASGKAGLHDWFLLPLYLPFYALGWVWGKLDAVTRRFYPSGSGR